MSKPLDFELDVAGRVSRLKTISGLLLRDLHNAHRFNALHGIPNEDKKFQSLFDQTYEAHGLNAITQALMEHVILITIRMHDRFDAKRRDHNRASFRHVAYLLESPGVAECLVEEARNRNPGMDWEDRNASLVTLKIQEILKDIRSFEGGERLVWVTTLRRFRDEFLAHSLFDLPPEDRAKFGYIGDLLEAAIPLVRKLRLVAHGEGYSESDDDLAEIEGETAKAFWDAVRKGMVAKKREKARRLRELKSSV